MDVPLKAQNIPLKAQKLLGEKPQITYQVQGIVTTSGPRRPNTDNDTYSGMAIPAKAQKILGERSRSRTSREQEMRETGLGSFGGFEAHPDIAPGTRQVAGPTVLRSARSGDQLSGGNTLRSATSTTFVGQQPSNESMSREYYDSARQPMFVSQQTSESSVRDMALRKGTTPASETSSDAPLLGRSFNNMLKYRRAGSDRTANEEPPKRERKIDLASLFPHSKGSMGSKAVSTTSDRGVVDQNDSPMVFPDEPRRAQVTRKGSKLRMELDQQAVSKAQEPREESNVARAKVFTSDIYDSQKINTYRPPKGVQNWFDGWDISSGEEEENGEEQASRETPRSPPVELPANDISQPKEALPSVFSLHDPPARDMLAPYRTSSRFATQLAPSLAPAGTKLAGKVSVSRQLPPPLSTREASLPASAGQTIDEEVKGQHSRHGSHSVLSSSSGSSRQSEEEDIGTEVSETPSPSASRQLGESQPQHSVSAREQQTHILDDDIINSFPSPAISRGKASLPSKSPKLATGTAASLTTKSRSTSQRPRTTASSGRKGSLSSNDKSSSSVPTDASRLMAVTEEEMMLLELMRQKRAAMQRDRFGERSRVAHQKDGSGDFSSEAEPALMSLSQRGAAAGGSSQHARGKSGSQREEMEYRRRVMSDIRKEDVDRAFKMGRFLAAEGSADETPHSRIERFLVMAPGLAGEFNGRPISGTEIDMGSGGDDFEDLPEDFDAGLDSERGQGVLLNPPPPEQLAGRRDKVASEDFGSKLEEMEAEMEEMTTPTPLTEQDLDFRTGDLPTEDQAEGDSEDVITALPSLPGHDIKQQSVLYDGEGHELLSPKVFQSHQRHMHSSSLDHLRTDNIEPSIPEEPQFASPDTPVATTWAQRMSLKHPRPYRQQAGFDFATTPTDPQGLGVRMSGLSEATSLPSPSTPGFGLAYDKGSEARRSLGTDSGTATASPQSEAFSTTYSRRKKSSKARLSGAGKRGSRSSKSAKPGLEDGHSVEEADLDDFPDPNKAARGVSMASFTSAGEDVLAAWAELGGGRSEVMALRRRK